PTIAYHDAFTTWGAHSLNPQHRSEYVARVQRDASVGYAGQFMDDLEWENSGQNEPGSDPEVLALVEAVRSAIGPSAILELNTQESDLQARLAEHNSYAERALRLVNVIDREFGVSQIVSASGYASFLAYADAPGGSTVTIPLGKAMRTASGQSVSSVTLPGRSGVVLIG